MGIQRGLIVLVLLVALASFVVAQECLPDGEDCEPRQQLCSDGETNQFRSTDYSDPDCWVCTAWSPICPEVCDNSQDDDEDGDIDCADSECADAPECQPQDTDGDGYTDDVDCDDNNNAVYPGATETCNNIDDDCNNQIDESLSRQCGSTDVGACQYGSETCGAGIWGQCAGAIDPITEICDNNLDDDCDGQVDEDCPPPEGPPEPPTPPPEEPPAPPPESPPEQPPQPGCIDADGDGFGLNCFPGNDCDDADPAVRPGAPEICNNKDDNCNGRADEALTRQCGPPARVGICRPGFEVCQGGIWTNCNAITPKTEICGNQQDEDCDGEFDNGCGITPPAQQQRDAFERMLAADNKLQDFDRLKQKYQETRRFINIEGSSEVADGKTTIYLKFVPIKHFKNIIFYHEIPKTIAASAKDIRFSIEPRIIEDDPKIAWHFASLDKSVDISYEVDKEVENAIDMVSIIAVAEESSPIESPIWLILLPIFIIPVLGSVLVFFARAAAA